MANQQIRLFLDESLVDSHSSVPTFPSCHNQHHTKQRCRRCFKRTLEQWGFDAEGYFQSLRRKPSLKRIHSKPRKRKQYDPFGADKYRLAKYGITAQQYTAMLRSQHYKCAICRNPETATHQGIPIFLAVDHQHSTGKVRGLLCQQCNLALAFLERQGEQWCTAAWDYLHRYAQRTLSRWFIV